MKTLQAREGESSQFRDYENVLMFIALDCHGVIERAHALAPRSLTLSRAGTT